MAGDDTDTLREHHDDVPAPDDFEESLTDPETHRRLGGVGLAQQMGRSASRAALAIGGAFSLYVVLLKLPAVVFGSQVGFLGEFGDPIAGVLLLLFGILWGCVGAVHLWGAWSFYRLRRLQNSPTRRAGIHALRGAVILATGVGIAGVAVAYATTFTATL